MNASWLPSGETATGPAASPTGTSSVPSGAGIAARTRGAASGPDGRTTRRQAQRQGDGRDERQAPRRAATWDGLRGGRFEARVAGPARRLQELDPRVRDVVEAVLRVAFEAAAQEPADRGGGAGGQLREVDLVLEHAGERVGHRVGGEERPAGEHLVEDDAERPDVGALVDGLAPRLLGRHVGRGAEDDAELRPVRGRHRRRVHERRRAREVGRGGAARGRVHRLGQAEVEDLDLPVRRELHVGGLEVAVDDSLLVRGLERLGDLPGDGEGLVEGERPALQPLGEVFALDELHDEGADAARLLEAVDRGDVGVLELGEDLRLALEAREAVGVRGERLGEDLDRDLALQLRVGRAVDDPHPALAERGGDLVGTEAGAGSERHRTRRILRMVHPGITIAVRQVMGGESPVLPKSPRVGFRLYSREWAGQRIRSTRADGSARMLSTAPTGGERSADPGGRMAPSSSRGPGKRSRSRKDVRTSGGRPWTLD